MNLSLWSPLKKTSEDSSVRHNHRDDVIPEIDKIVLLLPTRMQLKNPSVVTLVGNEVQLSSA